MPKILLLKLFVVFLFQFAIAQERKVTGKVSDLDGKPLAGVSVQAKGSSAGTATTADGLFSIDIPPGTKSLVFSHAGMESKEIAINSKDLSNVQLIPLVRTNDEVIVIGYGNVKKSDLTGSVATLKGSELNDGIITSVDQAIKGKISGVQVMQTSAEPGGGFSIRIRGATSVTGGNEPLYVIDGLPIENSPMLGPGGGALLGATPSAKNPLNSLNPTDIQSIQVLKDASATAIYGSRGANGVILITTKSGARGKVQVSYDLMGGLQYQSKAIDILSTEEYIRTMNELSLARGNGVVFEADDIARIGKGTDWPDEILRTAFATSHNLSLSGGTDKSKLFISANYYDQQGIVKNSGIKKYIFRLNLEQNVGENFKVGVNLNSSFIKDNNNVDGVSKNEAAGPINTSLLYDPTIPVKNDDGTFGFSNDLNIGNPAALLAAITSEIQTNRTFGNLFTDYSITNDLSARLTIGLDRQIARRDLYNSTLSLRGGAGNGAANIASLERVSSLLQYTMNYKRTWKNNNSLNSTVGVTYEDFTDRSFSSSVNDFPTDVLGVDNLDLGNQENAQVGSNKSKHSLLSYLGRVNFSLNDRVLLTSSIRADGSSRFGANNKFGYFPSFAVAWRLINERFVPPVFTDLKLRASWGMTGNQEIGNYAAISAFRPGILALLNGVAQTGTQPSRVPNPDLKWETTKQLNFGIDASILSDRISASVDYFIKNTEDMLLDLPVPQSSGFTSTLYNVGSMSNKGFEIMINSRNIVTKNFKWSSAFNFSVVKNKVTNIGDLPFIITGTTPVTENQNFALIRPGDPLNAYYGYKITGIFQDQHQVSQSAQPLSRPGNPIFLDANGDGTINPDDRVILGSPFPDYIFGLSNTLNYKQFQLDIFIDGQKGADLLNGNAIESMFPVNERRNRIADQIFDRWTPDNPGARWPSALSPSTYGGSYINSLTIEDASFIRIQSVQLGYSVQKRLLNFINSAKFYATVQNLAVFTDYTGSNPEANAFGNSNSRIDYNAYPLCRIWSLGCNLTF